MHNLSMDLPRREMSLVDSWGAKTRFDRCELSRYFSIDSLSEMKSNTA